MQRADVLEELPLATWAGPFSLQDRARAVDALESGRVVFLPNLAFTLAEDERLFLDPAIAAGDRKNISLDPGATTCDAALLAPADSARLAVMMDRFAQSAQALVAGLAPAYAAHLERARTSYRPAEIAGRAYSPRHDDKRLHVDAFPTRPMRGKRILRVFSNIAADGAARDWRVGEPFEAFAGAFLPKIRGAPPGLAWAMQTLGLTKGRRSLYDQLMLGLHDAAKLDEAYQASAPQTPIAFPAGSIWFCFTDQVLHAALSGHSALEQTFHLPVAAMAAPERSPLKVLERLSGRVLA